MAVTLNYLIPEIQWKKKSIFTEFTINYTITLILFSVQFTTQNVLRNNIFWGNSLLILR